MQHLRIYGLFAALTLASGTIVAQDSASKSPSEASPAPAWMKKILGPEKKRPQPPKEPLAKPALTAGELAAKSLAQEQTLYLQRLTVCTKLRQLALDAKDEKLAREADELEAQATAVYKQKTSGFTADVTDYEQKTGVTSGKSPLTSGSADKSRTTDKASARGGKQ